jgi:hypothetical protein
MPLPTEVVLPALTLPKLGELKEAVDRTGAVLIEVLLLEVEVTTEPPSINGVPDWFVMIEDFRGTVPPG